MDQPLATFEVREKYLLVVGHGRRDNLLTMAEAARQIVSKAIETNRNRMLVDYRKLEINVHMGEAFNIVKNYEQNQPELKNIIVAAVFDPKSLSFAKFWKEVSAKRGFRIEIFEDIDFAERWLISQP